MSSSGSNCKMTVKTCLYRSDTSDSEEEVNDLFTEMVLNKENHLKCNTKATKLGPKLLVCTDC